MPSYVSRQEAALILSELGLPTAAQTLANLAAEGHGPAFALWGRQAVYEVGELHRWADARLSVDPRPAPKSERAAA